MIPAPAPLRASTPQDVCVSIWLKDTSHDLMFKVTDVCDPKDCPTPLDVKVEPYKGKYLFKDNRPGSRPEGPVIAYFVKCWGEAGRQGRAGGCRGGGCTARGSLGGGHAAAIQQLTPPPPCLARAPHPPPMRGFLTPLPPCAQPLLQPQPTACRSRTWRRRCRGPRTATAATL